MELEVRIAPEVPREPVISVDGAWGAPGLNLSHWPGQRTPAELRHDLSTGSALAFARLAPERRAELARGCRRIVNNHYDTDGTCALFAVRHPARALELERELLDAARAGDLFQMPSELGFQVDCIVAGVADVGRSPIAERLRGLPDAERWTAATLFLLDELPAILRGDLAPYRALWERELELVRADLAALKAAQRDDLVHLDWSVWNAAPGRAAPAGGPGRHALFGSTPHDRVLYVEPAPGGALYRFALSTLSWFELVTRSAQPRPDLARLAARLNELEGTREADASAWRAQDVATPSPELWFGAREHELFAERCPALHASALPPSAVRREIAEALRGALAAALPS